MKNLGRKIKENLCSIVQIVLLIILLILPVIVDASSWIEFFFQNSEINFETAKYYFLLEIGNWGIGIVLMLLTLFKIRKYNSEKLFNTKNVYHDYPYMWYWICAKILGYTKCNLKRVPIYLEFKLVLEDTFSKYDVGTEDDYPKIENEEIEIYKKNWNPGSQEINLILSDTYPIMESQLPARKSTLPILAIVRKRSDKSRYYSPRFISKIVDEVRNLPRNMTFVNIFATTNAKHTKQIVEDAFKMAERGNVKKLVVFQQSNKGMRRFKRNGKVMYDFR